MKKKKRLITDNKGANKFIKKYKWEIYLVKNN